MRKYVKLVSALLILVMMMAQVVCVGAATKATVSYSAKQTDHFEKTITVKFTNAENVTDVYVKTFKDSDATSVQYEKYSMTNVKTFDVTLKVKPNDEKTFRITYKENGENVTKEYNIGGNSYYNPGSATAPKEDYYTGLIGGSSSSSNNGTIIYSYVTDNGCNVYEKWSDVKGYEVKKYDYYYVTCRTLNVRNGAGTWADKVGTLKRNAKVKVYDITKAGWAVIEYNGHLRYVSARYLAEY